jgi:hypothetical protein
LQLANKYLKWQPATSFHPDMNKRIAESAVMMMLADNTTSVMQ